MKRSKFVEGFIGLISLLDLIKGSQKTLRPAFKAQDKEVVIFDRSEKQDKVG